MLNQFDIPTSDYFAGMAQSTKNFTFPFWKIHNLNFIILGNGVELVEGFVDQAKTTKGNFCEIQKKNEKNSKEKAEKFVKLVFDLGKHGSGEVKNKTEQISKVKVFHNRVSNNKIGSGKFKNNQISNVKVLDEHNYTAAKPKVIMTSMGF